MIQREKKVILYGQSARFRVVKYAILIPLFAGLYVWKGIAVMLWTLGALALVGIAVHFWLCWTTDEHERDTEMVGSRNEHPIPLV